jgi:hypothetical protein
MTAVVAWISSAVAALSVFYTARTFALADRPYVGIVEHSYELRGNPVSEMTWRFILKNVDAQPTLVTVDEHRAVLTSKDGIAKTLPLFDPPAGGIYMMLVQTADLTGQFSDEGGNARVADVMTRQTRFVVSIRLTYTAAGAFWRTARYSYRSEDQLRTNPMRPRFVMLSGGGN